MSVSDELKEALEKHENVHSEVDSAIDTLSPEDICNALLSLLEAQGAILYVLTADEKKHGRRTV